VAAEDDVLRAGFRAGLERAATQGVEVTDAPLDEAFELLLEVVGPEPIDLHPRFIALFAEQVAIASAARSYYRDAPLTPALIRWFLDQSRRFFNSFVHP
jgi:hypothetical protein